MTRLRRLCSLEVRKGVPGERPVLNLENIASGEARVVGELAIGVANDLVAFEPGDVLFSKLRPYLAKSLLVTEPMFGTAELLSMRASAELDPRFLLYITMSAPWLGLATMSGYGTKMPRTSWDALAEFDLYLPPLDEQRRIANFLDGQVALLDQAIALRQQQRDLLEERRYSNLLDGFGVAHDVLGAVEGKAASTHGWPVRKLSRLLSRTIAGGTPTSSDPAYWCDEGGTPWISIGDMVEGGETSSTQKQVTEDGRAAVRLVPAPAGTVLFAMYASVGKTSVSGIPAIWNQAILGLVPGPALIDRFLLHWLEVVKPVLPAIARSATQDNLNAEQVKALRIPHASLEEQTRLVNDVRQVDERSAELKSLQGRHLSLLEERKQSLITAAVMGEFDVSTARKVDVA